MYLWWGPLWAILINIAVTLTNHPYGEWESFQHSSSINKHSHLAAAGAFLLVEGAWVPSLNPFFALLKTCFKYLILPVPSVFLLFALTDQLSIIIVFKTFRILTSSLGGAGVTWRSASLLLSVPGLFTVDSAQGVGLVVTTTHGRSSLSLCKHRSAIKKDRRQGSLTIFSPLK